MESDDTEFLDGLIGRPITVSDRVRLFALARRGTAVQWRPIEEAPKDELILVGPTKRMGICAAMNHSRDGWVTETCADWVPIYTPTHWMPLPPPPAGETND